MVRLNNPSKISARSSMQLLVGFLRGFDHEDGVKMFETSIVCHWVMLIDIPGDGTLHSYHGYHCESLIFSNNS
jgi:hypothetical protein